MHSNVYEVFYSLFSPTFFGRYYGHLQGDVIITRI